LGRLPLSKVAKCISAGRQRRAHLPPSNANGGSSSLF
jgi:hypothetical protein